MWWPWGSTNPQLSFWHDTAGLYIQVKSWRSLAPSFLYSHASKAYLCMSLSAFANGHREKDLPNIQRGTLALSARFMVSYQLVNEVYITVYFLPSTNPFLSQRIIKQTQEYVTVYCLRCTIDQTPAFSSNWRKAWTLLYKLSTRSLRKVRFSHCSAPDHSYSLSITGQDLKRDWYWTYGYQQRQARWLCLNLPLCLC